eukprot:COSAG02_NODE_710_length_18178_cov_14.361524_6_plen_148_part_00
MAAVRCPRSPARSGPTQEVCGCAGRRPRVACYNFTLRSVRVSMRSTENSHTNLKKFSQRTFSQVSYRHFGPRSMAGVHSSLDMQPSPFEHQHRTWPHSTHGQARRRRCGRHREHHTTVAQRRIRGWRPPSGSPSSAAYLTIASFHLS